jgi:hypothetical protein
MPAGPGKIALWVSRNYMQEDWHIQRMLLRVDGFASVTAPWSGGQMITKPFTFKGDQLELNFRTSAAGFIRVEIQDANGKPIPDYTLDDCPPIIGDEIERVVHWNSGSDVSRLGARTVRLRFMMKDADLFSLRFRTGIP